MRGLSFRVLRSLKAVKMLEIIFAVLVFFGTLACAGDQPREAKRNKSDMLKKNRGKEKLFILFILLILLLSQNTVKAQEADYELLWSRDMPFTTYVSVSQDGSYIAAGSGLGVYLFNREGELLWTYYRDSVNFLEIAISSDGSYIAVSGDNGKVYLFNREGVLLWNYESFFSDDADVSISSDGSYIAAGAITWVDLFNQEGERLWRYNVAWHRVGGVSISSDGLYIAVLQGGLLHFLKTKPFNYELLWINEFAEQKDFRGVSVSSDGSYIAVVSGSFSRTPDDKVYFFDRTGELIWAYNTSNDVSGVSVSADGSYIAAGSGNGTVYLFNQDGKLIWSYNTNRYLDDVSISADGSYIAAGVSSQVYLFTLLERVAKSVIAEAKNLVESERAKGFNLAEANVLISQAEQAFSSGEYTKAKELADQAKVRAEKELEAAKARAEKELDTANTVTEAESIIYQEKMKGFNVAEAEALLSQAEQSFEVGNYEEAKALAENAAAMALDIDQDGVANEEDFVPTIKNVYIYAAIPVAILLLIGVVKAGLVVKNRATVRAEIRRREELERERIRREEERKRLEYERKINEIKAKYERYKREGYAPNKNLEEMLK